LPQADETESIGIQKYTDEVLSQLNAARSDERWLASGWTLPEGLLLSDTHLVDADGTKLPGDSFSTGTEETVRDITILITKLAYYLAQVYFIQMEGHEPDTARPSPHAAHLLSTAPEIWLRWSHQTFMASGFVEYNKHDPLDILAGKRS
jgi:hypothetical protein